MRINVRSLWPLSFFQLWLNMDEHAFPLPPAPHPICSGFAKTNLGKPDPKQTEMQHSDGLMGLVPPALAPSNGYVFFGRGQHVSSFEAGSLGSY